MTRKTARCRLCLWMSLMVAAVGVLPTTVRAEMRMAAALTPEAVWDAINAAKLNMTLRPWRDPEWTRLQAEHVKEGRDFFNETPKPAYYTP